MVHGEQCPKMLFHNERQALQCDKKVRCTIRIEVIAIAMNLHQIRIQTLQSLKYSLSLCVNANFKLKLENFLRSIEKRNTESD